MAHMFHFSDKFMNDYAPNTVELGRSFVAVDYQNVRKNTKSIFALDNLWDGLGALTVINPRCKYFLGKMTMYPSFNRRGRDMILYFLRKHFGDKDGLITPIEPVVLRLRGGTEGYLLRGRLPSRLPHPQSQRAPVGLQHPAAGERLHEPIAHHEILRNGHQPRVWRGGGKWHTHCRR